MMIRPDAYNEMADVTIRIGVSEALATTRLATFTDVGADFACRCDLPVDISATPWKLTPWTGSPHALSSNEKSQGWSVKRIISMVLVVNLLGLLVTNRSWAIPPLPSSFYGTVKVNSQKVPDGTIVRALIGGQIFAETLTQTYQGESVYALDIPGDDLATTQKDGGRENETIQFEVGGAQAGQAGKWKSGTNVNLNLTAAASAPITKPQATIIPIPSQTAIVVQTSPLAPTVSRPTSPVSTSIIQPVSSVTMRPQTATDLESMNPAESTTLPLTQLSTASGESDQLLSNATMSLSSYPTPESSINPEENRSQDSSLKYSLGVIALFFIGMITLLVTRSVKILRK